MVLAFGCDCFSTAGSFDISCLPEVKGQAPKTGDMPAYVNTQQIDAQVLAALQAEAENVTKGVAAGSPPKDLFDMSKCPSLTLCFTLTHWKPTATLPSYSHFKTLSWQL